MTETQVVERLLAELRAAGTAVLLVSHRLDQVFRLADRIAVLREGRIVAEVSPLEVHPDDVIALISGVEADSTARRQLHRLHSLVDQLAEVEPAASLPLIVSAMAEALGVDQLCVHLLERRATATSRPACAARPPWAWPPPCGASSTSSRWAPTGARPARPPTPASPWWSRTCAATRWWAGPRAGADPTIRSSWSVPIAGSLGVLGTISGFADTVGRPQDDQLELVSLYASYAASAIEREVLLADATHRNRVLETLRGVLDTLAGPQPSGTGLSLALVALCRGLGADAIALHDARRPSTPSSRSTELGPHAAAAASQARSATPPGPSSRRPGRLDRARPVGDARAGRARRRPRRAGRGHRLVGRHPPPVQRRPRPARRRGPVAAAWPSSARPWSRPTPRRRRCAGRNRLQQEFLSRLNHELRTPLTAIQGYASTLRQPDVSWDESSQQRFLDSIASESARMARLVGDLLDFSAIDSGILRLLPDWCDLGLVLEAARRLRDRGTAGPVRHRRRPRPAPDLGRPRPPGAGVRQPVRERRAPRRRADPGDGGGRARPGRPRPCWCGCPTTAPA